MDLLIHSRAIAKREWCSYFNSPVAYIFIVIFLVLAGFFTFSVSGNLSTQDYSVTSAARLAATIRAGLRPGSVIVMHMSDNSQYTAEALETILSENDAKPEEKQVKFARLDTYLQDGYDFR